MQLDKLLEGYPVMAVRGSRETDITNVTYDSRKVRPGSLFVCIDGFNADGHTYIPQAAARGAAAVIVQKPMEELPEAGCAVVRVADSRKALSHICHIFFGRPSDNLRLAAVTGGVGKHTLSYLLYHFCRRRDVGCGLLNGMETYIGDQVTYGSRNHPGPLELQGSLAALAASGQKLGVLPVGQQDILLDRVSDIRFEIGVLLNSEAALTDRETAFYRRCRYLVLNRDDISAHVLSGGQAGGSVLTIGIDEKADIRAEQVRVCRSGGCVGTRFCVTSSWFPSFETFVPSPARFNVYNRLTMIAVLTLWGFPIDEIRGELPAVVSQGRTQRVDHSLDFQVFIDSAWTPKQLEHLLMAVRPYCQNRLIVVFGAGGNRSRSSRTALGCLCGSLADFSVLTVTSPRGERPEAITADLEAGIAPTGGIYELVPERSAGIERALRLAEPGDLVLLAGKGEEAYEIGRHSTHPVSDLTVARTVLTALEAVRKRSAGSTSDETAAGAASESEQEG